MGTRFGAVLMMGMLVVSACGGPVASPAQPSASDQPSAAPTSGQPTPATATKSPPPSDGAPIGPPATVGPQQSIAGQPGLEDMYELTPEDLNPPVEPLPEPLLTTVDAVTEAIFALAPEDQIIVSMLDLLDVGIYREDGTPFRAGSEQSDDDFYLFEPEVYGLIEMLRDGNHGEGWVDFSEFHGLMTEFGFTGSSEDLIGVYSEAYAAQPDAAMARFVQANAFLEVEAQIPPLGAWLLFVDGMIPPHVSASAAGAALPAVAQGPNLGGIGQAYPFLQPFLDRVPAQADVVARMSAALRGAFITMATDSSSAHEGHGGSQGTPVTVTATLRRYAPNSPFSNEPRPICDASPANVPVNFTWDSKLTAHGTIYQPDGLAVTDGAGDARLLYTPKPEDTRRPEDGWIVRDIATVTATASRTDVIRGMCPFAPPGVERLARGPRGTISKNVRVQIRWHVPRAMRITLSNRYDLYFENTFEGDATSVGLDTYDGVLVEQADGTWTGAMFAVADGSGGGMFFGLPGECRPDWNASQVLEVFGERAPIPLPGEDPLQPTGDFQLTFYPLTPPRAAYGTTLCSGLHRPGSRYDYIPLADARVWDTNVGLGLTFPTQDLTYDTYEIPSTANVSVDADWTVIMHLLKPPPVP